MIHSRTEKESQQQLGERRGKCPNPIRIILILAWSLAAGTFALAQDAGPPRDGSIAPKKSNERPSDIPAAAPEPFDGATTEKMAAQCVTLTTEAGPIEMEMFAEAAPESVRNFLNLSATGAFDGTTFSRVVKDFVVQGGNLSTGQKWTIERARRASRKIPDEPSYVKHVRGIVSLARPDEPNSATTHFFILVAEATQLDGKFAAFGRVTRGIEVVDTINKAPVEGEKPVNPVKILQARVSPCESRPAPSNSSLVLPRRETLDGDETAEQQRDGPR